MVEQRMRVVYAAVALSSTLRHASSAKRSLCADSDSRLLRVVLQQHRVCAVLGYC
jgi:hypothetical protein